jgi:putative PIN family toxin of toxin-antitoxin system
MTSTVPETAVLDTNIWLDWLVFENASVQPLMRADFSFVANQAMRSELKDVLGRTHFCLEQQKINELLEMFDRTVTPREAPEYSVTRLRCTDRDDQKFVELAVATRASFLVTRDKALLKLAKRASREHRLAIVKADHWPAQSKS